MTTALKSLSNNYNIQVFSGLTSVDCHFPWEWVTFSWFFMCPVIWDCILDMWIFCWITLTVLTLDSIINLHSGLFWNAFNLVGLKLKTLPYVHPVQFFLPLAIQSLPHAYMVQGQPESWAQFTHHWSSFPLAFSLVGLDVYIPTQLYFLVLQARKTPVFYQSLSQSSLPCWHPAFRPEPSRGGSSPHAAPLIHVPVALLSEPDLVCPLELSGACCSTSSQIVWAGPTLPSQSSTSLIYSSSLPPLSSCLLSLFSFSIFWSYLELFCNFSLLPFPFTSPQLHFCTQPHSAH